MIHNDMDNEIHILTVAGGAKHHLGVGFLFGLSFKLQIPAFQNRREGILIRVGKQSKLNQFIRVVRVKIIFLCFDCIFCIFAAI